MATSDAPALAGLADALRAPTTPQRKTKGRRQAPERFTHGVHPWPARFSWRLPLSILRLHEVPKRRPKTILDPFAGSGTTLVETTLAGVRGIGCDLNPVAELLCSIKATPLPKEGLVSFERQADRIKRVTRGLLKRPLPESAFRGMPTEARGWYTPQAFWELQQLADAIAEVRSERTRRCLQLALSSLVVKVSLQRRDSSRRKASTSSAGPRGGVFRLFSNRCGELLSGMRAFSERVPPRTPAPEVRVADARALDFVPSSTVDLCITSPPYGGVYDYADFHRFRALFLDLEWRAFEHGEIGARRQGPKAAAAEAYFEDTRAWVAEVARTLRPGGHLYAVIGDSSIGPLRVDGAVLMNEAGEATGLVPTGSLAVPRQNFHGPSARAFERAPKQEHLVRLSKPRR